MKSMSSLFLVFIALAFSWSCAVDEVIPPIPPTVTPPALNADWKNWVVANGKAIRSINAQDADYADLKFLKNSLKGRSIIQLGENGHRVGQFNAAKVRLIKFLHQEMGYDVIAFESGLYECFKADMSLKAGGSPREAMNSSIFGVWHCQETLALFDYIKSTWNTARPLRLAGFDVQSNATGIQPRKNDLKRIISLLDPAYAQEVYTLDSTYLDNWTQKPWLDLHFAEYKTAYQKAAKWLDAHREQLIAALPTDADLIWVLQRSMLTMPAYIDEKHYMDQNDNNRANVVRDRGMADQVMALHKEFYSGQKMILWAHNFHIGYNLHLPEDPVVWMGTWLHRWLRSEIYTVGLFFYDGRTQNHQGIEVTIPKAEDDSIEAMVYHSGHAYGWIDMLGVPRTVGSEWMWRSVRYINDGVFPANISPLQMFDALCFVRSVTPTIFTY